MRSVLRRSQCRVEVEAIVRRDRVGITGLEAVGRGDGS
jgi:hypothetical protein